ncbi:MAG TPA: DegT/DnrJ/EryC1/StrS aminotransferase family protein [Leptospiraceae bacterium]|nr:pyridoxal phosphate-dependent aminotransferase [Spirochaetaceae bacterium]HBS04681.1 DegT/DnrJ/EryC1/StrS aminotransferase family protein [Leptospiraceae bacterium]|tara:strand:- start:239 stop:1384 length:1146 start_codon:yes stop_codon:yes gene_type:complete
MALAGIYRTEKKPGPIEAQRPALSKEELESVLDCLIQDRLGSGSICERFEKSFAQVASYKHTLAVNSLTAAYHLAFLGLEVGPGDEIWMNALSSISALDACRYVGATPRLLDPARGSFHVDQESIQNLLARENEQGPVSEDPTFRVEEKKDFKRVFLLDHTYGSRNPLNASWLKENGFLLLEDFTGMPGADNDGLYTGQTGDIAVCGLSEYDLVTTGNGAMVVTSEPKYQKKMLSLRYGSKRDKKNVAYDYRLEDFQAAMGLIQLNRLGLTLSRRRKIGEKYLQTLRQTRHETYFKETGIDCYHLFPVVVGKTHDEVERYYNSLQIGITRIPEPLHHFLDLARLEFPNAERIYQKSVCVPVYPALTANNVERIASSLRGML